jgi:Rrf2 family protein
MARNSVNGASARDLSERLRLPLRALTNILNQLTHHGLVVSIRGARGGYRLAKLPQDISLAELIEAVEGPLSLTYCCAPQPNTNRRGCDRTDICKIRGAVQKVHASLRDSLNRVSLRDIAWDTVGVQDDAAEHVEAPQADHPTT